MKFKSGDVYVIVGDDIYHTMIYSYDDFESYDEYEAHYAKWSFRINDVSSLMRERHLFHNDPDCELDGISITKIKTAYKAAKIRGEVK